MTQAFQMSAIIRAEHKTVSFVLPLDNALTAPQPRHLTGLARDSSNVPQWVLGLADLCAVLALSEGFSG